MNIRCKLFLLSGLLASVLSAKELLPNRDFSKLVNGVPAGWDFQQLKKKSAQYEVIPARDGEPAAVKITVPKNDTQGFMTFRQRKNYPAGTRVTLSGEYRTENAEPGKDGIVLVNLMGRHDLKSSTQPKYWLNTMLKPAEKWTKFTNTGRTKYPLKSIQMNAGMAKIKGTIYLRNLSLDVVEPSHEPDPKAEWVWREAEDIDKIRPVNTIGLKNGKDYYSGRGAICTNKGNIDWTFQIPEVTDPVTLFSKPRTWYIWALVYGYLESPRFFVDLNDRYLTFVDTPANEVTDKQGKYLADGKYVWVLCGQFTTVGGMQKITFRAKGRFCLDAVFLTTDANYSPVRLEAKGMKQAPVQDISTANMIRAENKYEGVSDQITLPVAFRIGGKQLKIPGDKKPAVFHFSLPADIAVKGISSHWAGSNWNRPERWGSKFLTWKQTGSRTVKGQKINDYEAYLYYLCSNQYMVFLKADSKTFRSRKESVCEYWLENNGEKQLKETIALKHIAIRPAKPFKKIMIGPDSAPFQMMYYSYPDLTANLKACGMNYIGFWGNPWTWGSWFDPFRNQLHREGIHICGTVRQYTGAKKEHKAIGIDGKPVQPRKALTLAMTEKDAPIAETLERTKQCAATGVHVVFDDEMTNVLWDTIDYSPAVKKLFREWLAQNRKGVAYKEPELIVRDRLKEPEMYRHWVDFKCSRIAYWYSLYRKAFDEGVKLAKGKYPENMKPRMFTCVQGIMVGRDGKPCTVEAMKEAGYLDYRLLGKYCDIIEMMSYTYGGVGQSALPGDKMEMYNAYTGKNNTAVILLAGGYGTETTLENKVMLKYQVWDSLMQKPQIIIFYSGATLFNAPTLAPVVEAVRIAQPYEDFFVDGEKYTEAKAGSVRVRLKALRLGKKVLLYATNYDNVVGPTETVVFPSAPKSVLDCITGKKIEPQNNGFSFDFKTSRGRLFLVEM
ncbi:MAG: hypothetical protein J5806_03275 [Lentisphaeria bacterium]|nr:hypothetical protein [Lentisphaeria bacterium]